MLTSTFTFLQGIGPTTERRLWKEGLLDWESFLKQPRIAGLSPDRKSLYDRELALAQSEYEAGDLRALASRLHKREHWRFFEACRSGLLCLDIETTGLTCHDGACAVTVVGLHRNGLTIALVQGDTLTADRLQAELDHCTLLVTFFGTVFDVPFLRTAFPQLRFEMPHFDLCLAARRLGLRGGLKHLERELGIEREAALRGLDGMDAVRLWTQWQDGDRAALDLLLAYNAADTESLAPLAALIYKDMMLRFGPTSSSPASTTPSFYRAPLR
jgi:uncharacterized protein YprB with RNaseH-like and TPR domain